MLFFKTLYDVSVSKRIEYILEWNLLEKKCKTAILLYCFRTAAIENRISREELKESISKFLKLLNKLF